MKNKLLPIVIILGFFFVSVDEAQAQTPQTVNYQAVVRGPLGLPLNTQPVAVRFTIHQGSSTGTPVFTETHPSISTSTNQFGLINLELGSVNTAAFSAINWGTGGAYYLQIEVDPGSGFDDLGASQLLSVPYALFAKSAATGAQGFNSLIDTVSAGAACSNGGYIVQTGLDANANTVLDASEITSSFMVCNGATGAANSNDTSAINEIQTISINTTNDTIFLSSGGGFVVLPSMGADNDWLVNGNDMTSMPIGNVGIGVASPLYKLSVNSSDSIVASFTGTNADVAAISIASTNPSAATGIVMLNNGDSGMVAMDPSQNTMFLSNTSVGGHIAISADSSTALYGIQVANIAQDLIFNKSTSIYNQVDTIFNFSTTGTNINVNQGQFYTDSLYLLGNNAATPNWVLANDGGGQAKWTDPTTIGLGGGAFSSNGTQTTLNTITDYVGIGIAAPQAKLHINSGDTIAVLIEGNNVFGTFNVTQSLANGMVGELYTTGSDTVFNSLEPVNKSYSINYPKPGGRIQLQADTVQFSRNNSASVITRNRGNFYNKDTVYTDGLYVNDNMGTTGSILTDVGGGRAQWTTPAALGLGGLWQSNTPDIYFNTGKVGIGTMTPVETLDVKGGISAFQTSGAPLPSAWIKAKGYDDGIAYSGLLLTDALSNKQWNILHSSVAPNPNSFTIQEYNGALAIDRFSIIPGGNVGIGTTTPNAPLEVAYSNSSVLNPALSINNTMTGGTSSINFNFNGSRQARISKIDNNGFFIGTTNTNNFVLGTNNVNRIYINGTTGRVGIGAAGPSSEFQVVGTTTTDGLIVTATPTAGYVLTSDAVGNATWQAPTANGAWLLTGNTGTTPGTNFIGTTDNVALVFKTNGLASGIIDPVNSNSFFGYWSGRDNTTGYQNSALGTNSLLQNTVGYKNTAIGVGALQTNITGYNNTAIGFGADLVSSGLINATAIGANAIVGQSNSMVLGGTGVNAVNVGIGTSSPTQKLHVFGGSITIDDGANPYTFPPSDGISPGDIMTTDAAGVVKWKPNQIAFEAHPLAAGQSFGAGAIVSFGNVLLNDGNGFIVANNEFIAPVAGVYSFSVSVEMNSANTNQVTLVLQKNAGWIKEAVNSSLSGETNSITINSTVRLAVGDKIDVYMFSGNGATIQTPNGTWFSGHLVYAY